MLIKIARVLAMRQSSFGANQGCSIRDVSLKSPNTNFMMALSFDGALQTQRVGPRNCQGQSFASMVLSKIVPELVRKIDFEIRGRWKTWNN